MFIYMCLDNVTSCLWSIPSWDRRPSAYPSPSGPRYWPCSQAELVMFWRNLRGNPREWTRAPLVGFSHMGPVEVTSFHHERCPVKVMTVSWRCPKDGRLPALQIFGKALLCRKNHVLFVCVCVLFLGTFWTKNPKFSPKQVLVFSFLHIFWRKGFLHVFPTKFRFFIDPRGLQPVGAGRGQGHVEGRRGEVYLRRSKSDGRTHGKTMNAPWRDTFLGIFHTFSVYVYTIHDIYNIYIYIYEFLETPPNNLTGLSWSSLLAWPFCELCSEEDNPYTAICGSTRIHKIQLSEEKERRKIHDERREEKDMHS